MISEIAKLPSKILATRIQNILQNHPETEASIIDLTKEGTLLIKSEGFSKYLD